jgi:malate dehydrogenase (oxaloacetate-decarboxylating)
MWNLAKITNPGCIATKEKAFENADVLIAYSKPGPDTLKSEWIKRMAPRAIVFTCANPVPEIYPYEAKAAGAFIVATGRGDFPNQVNNSICFPSILKGTLLVAASKITDAMAITAAHSIARYAEERTGISPDRILPNMLDNGLFPHVAADVAMQAIREGVARIEPSREEVYQKAKKDISDSHKITELLQSQGFIEEFPEALIQKIVEETMRQVTL